MVQSKAITVDEYLKELSPDRYKMVTAIRDVIKKHLPSGFEEGMQYGMIGYFVPLSRYPEGYLDNPKAPLPFANLASQKNYVSVYLLHVYSDPLLYEWLLQEYKKTGKKLDMGKSCLRFRKYEDIPFELIGKMIAKGSVKNTITQYESSRK